MSDSVLRVERRPDGVAVLTLDDPDRRNAMTERLTAAWVETLRVLSDDDTLRAVVVTGAGRAFCSGGDLSWIAEHPDHSVPDIRTRMLSFYRSWLAVRDLPVPVLAAVNGAAIGAGLCLALACDLRYAADTATFSAPFARLGMHPGMAATYLLPEVVGHARARELLYLGDRIDAAEALRIGLVERVFPADALLDRVLDLAGQVAAAAPVAVRLTKAALGRRPVSLADALEYEALAQPVTFASADLREGLAAQAEKRPARFTGH